jgi:hypothetical protein
MFMKTFCVGGALVAGMLYFTGWLDGAYSRDIGRPMPEVLAALSNVDVRKQPGSPGADAVASGGVTPGFKVTRTQDSVTWTVLSGDKIATTMTAKLEPIDGGKGTHVVGTVEKGDANPDFVAPVFRSASLTMGLLAMMLESELNELTARRSRGESASATSDPSLFKSVQTVVQVNAAYGEYQRTGKDPLADDETRLRMALRAHGNDDEDEPTTGSNPEVSFEPGKPMVDLSKYHQAR